MNLKNKIINLFKTSIIIYMLTSLTNKIYDLLAKGFVGRMFTSYSVIDNKLRDGFFASVINSVSPKNNKRLSLKRKISRQFEQSRILKFFNRADTYIFTCSVKIYGAALLAFSIYVGLVYCLKEFALAYPNNATDYLFICISLLFISIFLLSSKQSIAEALLGSSIIKSVTFDFFDLDETKLELGSFKNGEKYNIAVASGMILGASTYFVHPKYYLIALVILTVAIFVLKKPEVGVLISVFIFPLINLVNYSSVILASIIILSFISYLFKLIKGKRIIRFKLIDICVIVFMLIVLCGGIVSAGAKTSSIDALLMFSLMLDYFLIVNLFRTPLWLERIVKTLLISFIITAIYGIADYFLDVSQLEWTDMTMFSFITNRADSFFENPNVFATYLVLILPLLLICFSRERYFLKKGTSFISLILLIACLLFTWSRGGWLGGILAIAIFFLILSRKALPVMILTLPTVPLASAVIPSNLMTRFLSIGNMSDSSTFYRFYTWKGVFRMIKDVLLGGVGVGESAFTSIYPLYAYEGIETVMHSHCLYLQILSETGIVGLLLFVLVIVVFLQNCFSFLKDSDNVKLNLTVMASIAGIAGALLMGAFDYIWYNKSVFLAFWIIIAIACSAIGIGRVADRRKQLADKGTDSFATVDIKFKEDSDDSK